jgi:hypothetical protein
MKKALVLTMMTVLALAQSAQASFTYTFNENALIPDGSMSGAAFTHQLTEVGSALPGPIQDLNVTLSLSGGYNGDLYAYLVHDTGFTVLLNRIGRSGTSGPGYAGSTLHVSLDDQGLLGNIHTYGGGALTAPDGPPATPAYSYQPDGRNVNPLTGNMTPLGTTALSSFQNLLGTGNWTLFVADVSATDQSTLTSWTLEIAAVPEPASLVEGAVAVLFLGGLLGLHRIKGAKAQPRPC